MSYILDALKKAAEQRDRRAPVLTRLLGPAPTPRSIWARSPGRLLAALLLNAGLLTALLAIWLSPVPITAPPEPVGGAPPATSRPPESSALEPRQTAPEPRRTREVREGKAAARERTAPEPPRPKVPKPTAATPASPRPAAPAQGAPAPAATPPVARTEPPPSPALAGLRLEALIYSDEPEKRMIFVNGRKYVEGDTIEGRLRVEEIQEDGVALSEQGRRTTLRIAR